MSTTMYTLKPIIKKCEIVVPNCMYKLKNIYFENNNTSEDSGVSLNILDVSEQIKTFLKVPNFIFFEKSFYFCANLTNYHSLFMMMCVKYITKSTITRALY